MFRRVAACALPVTFAGFQPAALGQPCEPEWVVRFPTGDLGDNATDEVHALIEFDDGAGPALYAGGSFSGEGTAPYWALARWGAQGWNAVGGPHTDVMDFCIYDPGGGPRLFCAASHGTYHSVERWDGTAWQSLGNFFTGSGVSVRRLHESRQGPEAGLWVIGRELDSAGSTLLRWTGGTSWTPVAGGLPGRSPTAAATYDDGTGPADYVGSSISATAPELVRLDGQAWVGVGEAVIPTSGGVTCLCVHDNGSGPALYVGGGFDSFGGAVSRGIARYDGLWSGLAGGVSNAVYTMASFNDGSGPALYAGGSFSTAGGVPAASIARWDGAAWSALGTGAPGLVLELTAGSVGGAPVLHVGGRFPKAGNIVVWNYARWDGSAWSALGNGFTGPTGSTNEVRGLKLLDLGSGPQLFATGPFTTASGAPATQIARFDGERWRPLADSINSDVDTVAAFDDGSGPVAYVGGNFTQVDGVPMPYLARWEGSGAWSAPPHAPSGRVTALRTLTFAGATGLYAAGRFVTVAGQTVNGAAAWDGSAWSPLGDGLTTPTSVVGAADLLVHDDGSGPAVFATGDFTRSGTAVINRVAKWDGAAWLPLGSGLGSPGRTLARVNNGPAAGLYVGGTFQTAGGVTANRVARWDGTAWSPLGLGINQPGASVYALASFYESGMVPILIAGGGFTLAGGQSARSIARWDGANWYAMGNGLDGGCFALDTGVDSGRPALLAAGEFNTTGGKTAGRVGVWLGCTPCYPDCNSDGTVNLADFGCFQTRYALADPYADCNGDGVRNLADFGCFQTKFALGCP